MFSQHKSEPQEPLTDFFQQLNAPLQKMPVQDRAELHTEMRQHLDALVAAHLELARHRKRHSRPPSGNLVIPTKQE